MSFKKQDSVTRNPHIRDLEITLIRTVQEGEPPESAEFRLTIDDQFDRPMNHRSGDLVPHLAVAEKKSLQKFMDAMWAKAEEEVIG